jgi:poly [ADP-ribose] polymerase 2/3/4
MTLDAMLNQTNIGNNNNKFYIIQLLQSDSGNKFVVWNRYLALAGHHRVSLTFLWFASCFSMND